MAYNPIYSDTKSSFGISADDWEKIKRVFSRFKSIDRVWLYGSRALGKQKKYSDIDLVVDGVLLDRKMLHQIKVVLEELNLPYIFDVSLLNNIDNKELVEHIDRVGKLIYQSAGD